MVAIENPPLLVYPVDTMETDLIAENERLRAENAALQERIAALEEEVARLKAELERLKGRLEEAERAGKRQAAPFSKGPPKANPKRPGRKAGHSPAHRPRPEQVHCVLEAELLVGCPFCGGELANHRVEEQFVIDLPPVEPIVTQFNVHIADCANCGQRVQGRHAEQISDALGAAAVQLGPRVLGLAAELKHGMGVPYRKLERIFSVGYGLEVSPGGLARGGQRLARQSEPTYDPTRAHGVAERVLGEAFDGILGCAAFQPTIRWPIGNRSVWAIC
jgi:hypothetical protein